MTDPTKIVQLSVLTFAVAISQAFRTVPAITVNGIAEEMNAGAQPIPIRVCPRKSQLMSGAEAQIAPPKIANPENATIVWRTPKLSSANPTGICINAKLQ